MGCYYPKNSKEKIMRVRISWKSLITGFDGHGDWFPESHKKALQEAADTANSKYAGEINHWIEEEGTKK
jgi:hypothetical protein